MKKQFLLLFLIILLFGCKGYKYQLEVKANEALDYFSKPVLVNTDFVKNTPASSQSSPIDDKNIIKDKVDIPVNFISQAPFADWDELHDEACEETSLLLVHNFLSGNNVINNTNADLEIKSMVDWQEQNWGGHHNLTISQTEQLAKSFYDYTNIKIKYDINIDDIKKELSSGNPVIVPCAGRSLPNPYFRSPGPIYHMLVIKGYDAHYFITNDVGTKRGADFKYKFDDLFDAIHDWNSSGSIDDGQKAMMTILN